MIAVPSDCHLRNAMTVQIVWVQLIQCSGMMLLQVMGLLLHGDAAFAGQGLVAELLQMSNVPGGQATAANSCHTATVRDDGLVMTLAASVDELSWARISIDTQG